MSASTFQQSMVKDLCMVSLDLIQTAHLCLRPLGQDSDGVWAELLLETCPRLRYFSAERVLILLSLANICYLESTENWPELILEQR